MCRYGANITGSRPYWHAKQQELQAIFATKGCATLFFTLSAADTHWDGFFDLMPTGYEDSPAGDRINCNKRDLPALFHLRCSRCTTESIATKETYRLSSTCGAPRNHTNVPPVYAHV